MRKINFTFLLSSLLFAGSAFSAPTVSTFLLLNGTQTQKVASDTMQPKFLQLGIGGVILKDDGFGNLDLGSASITNFLLLSGKIYVGSGSNVASQVTMGGDITINNFGVTTIGAGKITDSKVATGAAISRVKIAAGTPSYVLINSGAGDFSEEQHLSKSRGGIGADATGLIFPASGTLITDSNATPITNKTIGTTNSITVFDENFFLQDETLTSAKVRFQLSNISPSTTRTFTFPDQSDTLVSLSANQSLSSKTIDPTTNTIPLASGKILLGDFSGTGTPVTPSGDVTIDNTGITTIGAAAVDEGKIASSALLSTGDLSGGSGTKLFVNYTNVFTADSTVTANQIVYVKANGNVDLATSSISAVDTAPIGIVQSGISSGDSGSIYVRNGMIVGGFTGLTVGSEVYLSKSIAGAVTQSLVSFSGADSVILIGKAITTTSMVFTPRFKQAAKPVADYVFTSDGVALDYVTGQTLNATQYIAVYVDGRLQEEGASKAYTRDIGTGAVVFVTSAPRNGSLVTVVVYNM